MHWCSDSCVPDSVCCWMFHLPVSPQQCTKIDSYIAKGLQLSQEEYVIPQRNESHLVQNSVCYSKHNNCQDAQLQPVQTSR